MSFGEVTFDVIMDEKMLAYQEMFDWMKLLVENESKLSQDRASYSEILVTVGPETKTGGEKSDPALTVNWASAVAGPLRLGSRDNTL